METIRKFGTEPNSREGVLVTAWFNLLLWGYTTVVVGGWGAVREVAGCGEEVLLVPFDLREFNVSHQ